MPKRIIFSLYLFLTIGISFSQVWCYPGARWHFEHYNVAASLITRLTYIKDTTVFGKNCNKIEYYTQGTGMFGPVSAFGPSIYTHRNGNVVYILDVTGTTNNFDTLYNYGANIGDSWYMAPKSLTTCANSKITVTDTGHVFIQAQYLKWQKVNIVAINYSTPVSFSDTIFERIGCVLNYIYYPQDICRTIVDSEKGGPLRCYDDNQIVGYKKVSAACNPYSLTGITGNKNALNITLYPNPASNFIYVNLLNEKIGLDIEIANSLGQIVLKHSYTAEKINIEKLQSGTYFLKIQCKDYLSYYTKFIKE